MKAIIFILALAAAAATSAIATPFLQLCDTGVSNGATESPFTTVQVDSNFTVNSAPAGITTPYTYFTAPYYQSGANPMGTNTASWITTVGGAANTPETAVGTYNYQEAITTTNFIGTVPVIISGDWATDNCGTLSWGGTSSSGIGTPVGSGSGLTIGGGISACTPTSSAFTTLTAFSITETLSPNTTYYLDFNVYNSGGPTALLVDGLAASCPQGCTSATPEPSSVLLTLSGMVLLGLGMIRLRRTGNST